MSQDEVLAVVMLRGPAGCVELSAKIDTGAQISFASNRLVKEVGGEWVRSSKIFLANGALEDVAIFEVSICFKELMSRFVKIEVAVDETADALDDSLLVGKCVLDSLGLELPRADRAASMELKLAPPVPSGTQDIGIEGCYARNLPEWYLPRARQLLLRTARPGTTITPTNPHLPIFVKR